MKMEAMLRGMAGAIVLITVLLTHFHSINWLWATAFVGVNLLQSAFTGWCPAMTMLRKMGMK